MNTKRYEYIRDSLKNRIESLPVGTRLPSIRTIMRKNKCSLQTVNAALRDLEEEELIEVRHGSGIYVRPQSDTKYIEFHRIEYPSLQLSIQELSIARAIHTIGWKFCVRQHDEYFEETASSPIPQIDANILASDLVDRKPDFLEHMQTMKTPTIILGRDAGTLDVDIITGNDHQTLSSLIKHLRDLKHRQLAMLINEPEDFFQTQSMKEAFSEILDILDLEPARFISCETPPGGDSALSAYNGLAKYLQKHRSRIDFTSLVVMSSNGVQGALRAFYEYGISVPKDCSLVSFGLNSANRLCCPSVTESGIEDDAWGEAVVSLLKRRFTSSDTSKIHTKISPALCIRESTVLASQTP